MFAVCYAIYTIRLDEILACGIQIKAIEQYFHVVLFIMMYKVVETLSLWINLLMHHIKRVMITFFMNSTKIDPRVLCSSFVYTARSLKWPGLPRWCLCGHTAQIAMLHALATAYDKVDGCADG